MTPESRQQATEEARRHLSERYVQCDSCKTYHHESDCPNCSFPKPEKEETLPQNALDAWLTVDATRLDNLLNRMLLSRPYLCPYCKTTHRHPTNCPSCGAPRSSV